MTLLDALVGVVGAGMVVGSSGIAGYRLHLAIERHAPGLGALVPRDAGAVLGLSVGIATVLTWL